MRALVLVGPNRLELRRRHRPKPGSGEALVRTANVGICRTDLDVIQGLTARVRVPRVLGHEWSGVVEAVGSNVDNELVGKPVVGDNLVTCRRCQACRAGRWNDCSDSREIGFELDGAFEEYFVAPAENLRVLWSTIGLREACLVEPLAVAMFAVERAHVSLGDSVVVMGDGPIGLLCLQVALHRGAAKVALIGGDPGRLALGKQLGAAEVFNYHSAADTQARAPEGVRQVDVVVDASGSVNALDKALQLLGRQGRLVIVGDYRGEKMQLDPDLLMHRNLTIVGSNASAGTWDKAIALAGSGRVTLEPLISRVYPMEDWMVALDAARARGEGTVKVCIRFGPRNRRVAKPTARLPT